MHINYRMSVLDGFPHDFSIITTFRSKKDRRGSLFMMYSGATSKESLGLDISEEPRLIYADQNGLPGIGGSPRFRVNMVDGE